MQESYTFKRNELGQSVDKCKDMAASGWSIEEVVENDDGSLTYKFTKED